MSQAADIVVIGGGVMGTSIAWHLAARRPGRILVLEKSFLGAGGSGKSGAIIRQYYSHPLTAGMARYGLRFFERFPDVIGGPPVFTHTGLVAIAHEEERGAVESSLAMQRGLGIDTAFVSRDELRSIDPHCRLADDEIVAFEREAGYCEALQVVASFADAAKRSGVEVREGVAVRAIDVAGGRVAGVVTSDGIVATRSVIVAAGGWSHSLLRPLGIDLPVRACRTQVALFRRPAEFGPARPTYGDFRHQVYFKPTHGEALHVGNIDPREQHAAVDPDDYNELADPEFAREMCTKLATRYPIMQRGVGRGGYGALYDVTPDWHPVLDRLPGIDGMYCTIGFSGHGFKMSPAVGAVMTELVLDGSARTFDIAPLHAGRFAAGELFGVEPSARSVMG